MHETTAPFVETIKEREKRERDEADAMRRFPGVEFWWSNGERRAKLRGSGIEVWEAIWALEDLDWDLDRIVAMWPDVDRATIVSAVGYYRAWPEAVDARIAAALAYERAHMATLAEERARYSA